MKRMLWMLAALLMAGCEQSLVEERTVASESEELYAVIEDGSDSRTFLDDKLRLRWTADDRITVFLKEAYNREYRFTGVTGANAGGFEKVSVDDELYYAPDLPYTYAAYPHSSTTAFHEDGYFVLTMPAEQTYVENSVGLGANTMVAVTDTGKLMFKNAGSFLRVQLYGDGQSVKQITLSSIAGEALAGIAHITPSLTADPTCTMVGTTSSIVLNCEEAVVVNATADAPVSFWIVLPPVVLSEGYKVTVEDAEGETQEFTVNKVKTFVRNQYSTMKRELKISDSGDLEDPQPGESEDPEEPEVVYAEIHYAASAQVTPFATDVFGDGTTYVAEQSTYDSTTQTGVLKFSGDVTTIGNNAFKNCTTLTNITIPETVITIGNYAFYNCTSLQEIEVPNHVTTIGQYAYSGCTMVASATIGSGVKSIGLRAFQNCTGELTLNCTVDYNNQYYNDGWVVAGVFVNSKFTKVTIGEGVTAIGNYAFADCSTITAISLPSTLLKIGQHAFSGTGITAITIPQSVTLLEGGAFWYCSNLKKVQCNPTTPPATGDFENGYESNWWTFDQNASNRVIYVPESAFHSYITAEGWRLYGYTILKPGEVLDDKLRIDNHMLWYSTTDSSATVARWDSSYWGGANIVYNGYDDEHDMGFLVFDQELKVIGNGGLGNDTSEINTLTIPGSVTSISSHELYLCAIEAFYGPLATADNKAIVLGTSLVSYAADNKATSYTIPNNITEIKESAFANSLYLNSITIPDSVTKIERAAFNNTRITKATMNGVEEIGVNAFANCTKLSSVTIGKNAKTIGSDAFINCPYLTEVYCWATTPPTWGDTRVFDTSYTGYIYVPYSSASTYRKANGWKDMNIYGY